MILWCDLICPSACFLVCIGGVFGPYVYFQLHYLLCLCLNKNKIQIFFYIVYFIVRFYRTFFIDRSAASSQPFCLFIVLGGVLPRGLCLVYYPMSGLTASPSHHVVLFPAVLLTNERLFVSLFVLLYLCVHSFTCYRARVTAS